MVLEAGRRDHRLDFRIHMPAALTFPLASRFYNWWYESGPEPHPGGTPHLAQPGARCSAVPSTINGMIFIRGNRADFDGWASEDGMEAWSYRHVLPTSSDWRIGLSAETPTAEKRAQGSSRLPPATTPLRPSFRLFRTPAIHSRMAMRMVHNRKASAASTGPIAWRAPLQCSARLPSPRPEPAEPRSTDRRDGRANLFEGPRAVGVQVRRGRRREVIHAGEVGAAVAQSTRLAPSAFRCRSSIAPGTARHSRRRRLVWRGAKTSRTTPRSMCSTYLYPARELYPALKWWRKPWIGAQWLFEGAVPGRPITSRPAASSEAMTRSPIPTFSTTSCPSPSATTAPVRSRVTATRST